MTRDNRLVFAPLGAVVLLVAVVGLALLVPGYSAVRQTVSEIGEVGSPMQIPFTVALCVVAACLLVFAAGLWRVGRIGAVLVACMAVSAAGVGIFAFPHPLHNVFGLSELVGYQAPLALALALGRDPERGGLARFCWVMFALVWVAIALNLSSLARGEFWAMVKPIYGLVQRSLFAAWFIWAGWLGWRLWRQTP